MLFFTHSASPVSKDGTLGNPYVVYDLADADQVTQNTCYDDSRILSSVLFLS